VLGKKKKKTRPELEVIIDLSQGKVQEEPPQKEEALPKKEEQPPKPKPRPRKRPSIGKTFAEFLNKTAGALVMLVASYGAGLGVGVYPQYSEVYFALSLTFLLLGIVTLFYDLKEVKE
jgi:hypothetical protein